MGKTQGAIDEIMKMGRRKGEILEARLFVPIYFFDDEKDKIWRFINAMSLRFGLEIEACPVSSIATDEGRKMKDSVDNGVMMHVVKNVHMNIGAELIVFVTGDGDFVKFSTQAQNKGKKTEFWSVDPSKTNWVIKREGNFREILIDPDLQENSFLIALSKERRGSELSEKEKEDLRLVAKVADMHLEGREIGEMSHLISDHLGISCAQGDRLLEMLTTLKVAEVSLVARRVINIDYLHALFPYLKNLGSGENRPLESGVKSPEMFSDAL